jgi:endonuclease G
MGSASTIRRLPAAAFIALLAVLPVEASGAPTGCPHHYSAAAAPELINPRLGAKTRELCYAGFAVLHSGITRTPLWSAEHLTRGRLDAARGIERESFFHVEPALVPEERAELSDYRRSGFDRGHMAPSGDMPDRESQQESFSLANIIPQASALNRGAWEGIESAVRDFVRKGGEAYVVTGPVFRGRTLRRLNGRVLVPTGIFKAVYDPRRGQAGAYLAANTKDGHWQTVSISQLREVTGIDVFPGLPAGIKDRAMTLPEPRQRQRRSGADDPGSHAAGIAVVVDGQLD